MARFDVLMDRTPNNCTSAAASRAASALEVAQRSGGITIRRLSAPMVKLEFDICQFERTPKTDFMRASGGLGLVILGLFARTLENRDDAFLQVSARDRRSGLR